MAVPVLLIFWGAGAVQAAPKTLTGEDLNREFREVLEHKQEFAARKEARLSALKHRLYREKPLSLENRFRICNAICDGYMLFVFDSSYRYSVELCRLADRIGAEPYRTHARTHFGYALARGGFFKEAVDSLTTIDPDPRILPDSVMANYYICLGRTYQDLADYTNDAVFSPQYNRLGNQALAASLAYLHDPMLTAYVRGKIALKSGDLVTAHALYEQALSLCHAPEWLTVFYSTLAYIARKAGHNDEAEYYYRLSVINDSREAVRESVALRGLASILFYHRGEVDDASRYINMALDDATAFGTRHRMNVIGTLLPIFLNEQLRIDEERQQALLLSFVLSMLVGVILIVAAVNTWLQVRRLKRSRQQLEAMNRRLQEANRIKESYLGHYLDISAEIAGQLDDFVVRATHKMDHGQYEGLRPLLRELKGRQSKERIFEEFDRTFLSLFPTFVEEFNRLLPEREQIQFVGKSLNSTLRIFALIRLGITESDQIARALGYSLNTIYNYRTRMRNKSLDPKNFEANIQKIGL